MPAEQLSEQQVRYHALDLAVALHRETFRFVAKDTETPDIDGMVIDSATRFADWIMCATRTPGEETPNDQDR